MKFYRVTYRTEHGNSAGYSWHTSMADAAAASSLAAKNDPVEYKEDGPPKIEEVYIIPNKAGILEALTLYATHPDNG